MESQPGNGVRLNLQVEGLHFPATNSRLLNTPGSLTSSEGTAQNQTRTTGTSFFCLTLLAKEKPLQIPADDHFRLSAPKAVRWIVDGSTQEWSPRGWTNQLVEFDPGAAGSGGRGGTSWRWCSPTGVWPSPRAAHAMATGDKTFQI